MIILLVHPQIPQNTGNIARTCAATGTKLKLVPPLGFSLSDRQMKRAGLDYWNCVNVEEIEDLDHFLKVTKAPFFFFSTKAKKIYTDAVYPNNSVLIFGSETEGLAPKYHENYQEHFYKIPMLEGHRSLNLATSAAIVLYEALRQNHFNGKIGQEASKYS